MPRSRNIKPAFFKNEVLAGLPFEYRLLFIGIWTIADRAGRFEDRPLRIKMEVFPADNVDVDAGLKALHDNGFILRYSIEGQKYCQVLAWHHQNPHIKEAKSTIPAPCEYSASTGNSRTSRADSLIPDSLIPDSNSRGRANNPPPLSNHGYTQADFDARDLRRLKEAADKFDRMLESAVGNHQQWMSDEKKVYVWLCQEAGITVARGLELEAIQKKWPEKTGSFAAAGD
jgi:hypothetical protein